MQLAILIKDAVLEVFIMIPLWALVHYGPLCALRALLAPTNWAGLSPISLGPDSAQESPNLVWVGPGPDRRVGLESFWPIYMFLGQKPSGLEEKTERGELFSP